MISGLPSPLHLNVTSSLSIAFLVPGEVEIIGLAVTMIICCYKMNKNGYYSQAEIKPNKNTFLCTHKSTLLIILVIVFLV